MTKISEDHLEQLCLDWFRVGDYNYVSGPDIATDGDTPERSDYNQVIPTNRLVSSLHKINPHIPLGTLDEAAPIRKEIAFFSAIRAAIVKHTTIDTMLMEEQKNSTMKQILDNAVIAEGVADIFELAGLDKPNIALLSDEFLEDVRNMKSRNLAVELLEKLLRDEIRARTRSNVVLEKKFGDRLLETLKRYHARAIETAQVIEELIQMAKDFKEAMKRDEELGLNPDEVAFYDALANNESAVRELGDDILKKIAVEITEKLRSSTSVDWQVRESVRAKLRNLVRRTLRKWKYPPDKQEDTLDLVLKQAEVLCAGWSTQ